ncbi:MAG: hypothetical protein Q9198_010885, partial [Flavoplaca austrocitrina]
HMPRCLGDVGGQQHREECEEPSQGQGHITGLTKRLPDLVQTELVIEEALTQEQAQGVSLLAEIEDPAPKTTQLHTTSTGSRKQETPFV